MNQVLVTSTSLLLINDITDIIFLIALVVLDGRWFSELAAWEQSCIIFDIWSQDGGVEGWEGIWRVWQVECHCRVFLVDIDSRIRTIISGHKLGDAKVPCFFIFVPPM